MAVTMLRRTGKWVDTSTIWRQLRKAGYSRKVVAFQHITRSAAERVKFMEIANKHDYRDFVWVDETSSAAAAAARAQQGLWARRKTGEGCVPSHARVQVLHDCQHVIRWSGPLLDPTAFPGLSIVCGSCIGWRLSSCRG